MIQKFIQMNKLLTQYDKLLHKLIWIHAREQAVDTVTWSTAQDDSEVELLMMDTELINKIEKLEEKIEMLQANLQMS